jgi:hypothetical protein
MIGFIVGYVSDIEKGNALLLISLGCLGVALGLFLRPITQNVCTIIFNLAKDYEIDLGRLTPWIIAGIAWSWPHRVVETSISDRSDRDSQR